MNGQEIRLRRVTARIPGRLLCLRARVERGRLSDIERGYVQPSADEMARLCGALEELVEARRKLAEYAEECGWPIAALPLA
jgi:transcriptional regulator with XRE-family HTH domain